MKTVIAMVMTLTLAAICGCQSTSSRGGGVSEDQGFKIGVPTFDTTVKQGEAQSVVVSVRRDEYFKRDVKLEIRPSRGLSVEPTDVLVRASDKPDVQLRIAASKDAAIGDYRVYVKATPETGEATSTEFGVKVVAP